jgi:hypothetical protein
MEVIEHKIIHNRSHIISIHPIGDIHAGAIQCDEDGIRDKINEIKNDPNALIIGMGDYADCITLNDKRFETHGLAKWVAQDNIVESQRVWIKNLFEPVKDKIICLLEGNHESTIHRFHQDDILRNICKDLDVPYGSYQAFIVLKCHRINSLEKHDIVIHAWHGAGSAQTEGARLMRLMRLVNDIETSIYLMGHLHTIASYTPDRLIVRNGRIRSEKLIAVITGAWLKGYAQPHKGEHFNPSYIERQGYKPSRIGCPVIKIRPTKGEFWLEC